MHFLIYRPWRKSLIKNSGESYFWIKSAIQFKNMWYNNGWDYFIPLLYFISLCVKMVFVEFFLIIMWIISGKSEWMAINARSFGTNGWSICFAPSIKIEFKWHKTFSAIHMSWKVHYFNTKSESIWFCNDKSSRHI